jgi:hypothetical protein
MRYYELAVSDSGGGQNYLLDPSGLGFAKGSGPLASSLYTSQTTKNSQLIGKTNPNALNIEFDMPVYPGHIPQGQALIRLWGVGLKTLGQASNLNPVNGAFKTFTLKGGMSKGLPLANPAQSGLLAQGIIWQAFGNWQGTNQTLDIIVQPGEPPGNQGVAVSFTWKKGSNLQGAVSQMLAQAFPDYTPKINIGQSLTAPIDQVGCYRDINAFFQYLNAYTKNLGTQQYGADYHGVSFSFVGNTIQVTDGKGQAAARSVALNFQDLVGQPTWIDVNTVLFPTVLRGDINWGDQVTFPTGILPPYALTTPAAAYPNSPAASSSAFKGKFVVREVHHYANFREPDAASWNTTFTALYLPGA